MLPRTCLLSPLHRAALALLLCPLVIACDGLGGHGEAAERGELGEGDFVYECLSDTDTACLDRTSAEFPQAVAVGGRFAISFDVRSGPTPTVIPGSKEAIERIAGGFRMLLAGEAALLAVTGNSEVLDIKHLRGAEIAEVMVAPKGELAVEALRLDVGDELELAAVPKDESGVTLGGSVDYEWSSGDEQVLDIASLSTAQRVRVSAVAPGSTVLVVKAGESSFELAVEVAGSGVVSSATADAGPSDGGAG